MEKTKVSRKNLYKALEEKGRTETLIKSTAIYNYIFKEESDENVFEAIIHCLKTQILEEHEDVKELAIDYFVRKFVEDEFGKMIIERAKKVSPEEIVGDVLDVLLSKALKDIMEG